MSDQAVLLWIFGSWMFIGFLPAIPHLIGWKKGEKHIKMIVDYFGKKVKVVFYFILILIGMYIFANGYGN
jgi:hypothetical protein